MKHLWFYEPIEKLPTAVGSEASYRLRYFRVLIWVLGVFGPISLAFMAHGMEWESGATTLLAIAATVAALGGRTFFGETMAIKKP
jgi:hypothetical protein